MLIFLYDVISWDVSVTSLTLKAFRKFLGTVSNSGYAPDVYQVNVYQVNAFFM